VSDYDDVDFFTDKALIADPYPYFEALRDKCPVQREPHKNVVMVTGYDEAMAVYHDTERFSSCTAVTGPFPGFPVPLEGDDVSGIIEQYRDQLPFSDQLPTMDPPVHTAHRGLLLRLITPKRLKENEAFMWRLADRQIDEFVENGACEFIADYASPFALLVIAELLGVPEEDHAEFREQLGPGQRGNLGSTKGESMQHKPLEFLYEQFSAYVEDRRRDPRDDVLTGLATATFPDGSTPEVIDVVRVAANLFAAGQETTVRLLGAALQFIGERPELQQLLRDNRDQIPNFIEETLRIESPLRGQFRMARRRTTLAGVDIPPGASVLLLPGAANRDPRFFEDPYEFDIDRANARKHLGFGFGIHTCAGAPLARTEGRVTLNRLLDRTSDIRISETAHGPAGNRRYEYLPTYLFRGLTSLHLELTPAA